MCSRRQVEETCVVVHSWRERLMEKQGQPAAEGGQSGEQQLE